MLLYAALSAHAMPYVLDLELTGPPDHVYWPDSGHITESWNVPVIGPPLGTDAFDVSIGLDAVYTALVPSSSEALQFKFGCDWGGSGGGTGTQVIEIGEYLIFQPEALPTTSSQLIITGSGDTVRIGVVGSLSGGERIQRVHFQVPASAFQPSPVTAGAGTCRVRATLLGPTGFPDQPLLFHTTLADVVDGLADGAATAYTSQFGPASTPTAATIETELTPMLDALVSGGCLLDPSIQNAVSGAYANGVAVGTDLDGDLSAAAFDGVLHTFGAVLGDGTTTVGDQTPAFSNVSKNQLFAQTSDGGFFAGRYKRVAGKRGVFYGLSGVCDGPSDAASAIDPWFKGPLP